MIVLIGLIVLIAAVIVGVAAVVANSGDAHLLSSDFTVFNQHFAPSQGELFAAGIALGAVGMLGLALLLAGGLSSARRHAQIRRELRQSRREMNAARKDLANTPPPPSPAQQPVWSRNPFLRRPSGNQPPRGAQPQP
ncbi:hypothetical protein NDR87_02645 [Nocardia sp. CDC159]|uniref:Lipopolysaccharide assembly protein A domain-containing protein n=1 Tax=Nocardia pulmonis TaxID=2951408 RepID=A0A9X2IV55_9NOCA|nr:MULTISPECIES: hypothetical protein [Nocardia]MCM6772089.1 hypothetical protein [Nocardia pulmonis]MCM6785253.1 hypothetical protein [Nocardia sp. CDC159]